MPIREPKINASRRGFISCSLAGGVALTLPLAEADAQHRRQPMEMTIRADSGVMTLINVRRSRLFRGRGARLRELANEPDAVPPPALTPFERARLLAYAARFNARDFGTVRDMLADDVRLDLVNRPQLQGRGEVAEYFLLLDWRDDSVAGIRDFRFARYALDGAELLTVR